MSSYPPPYQPSGMSPQYPPIPPPKKTMAAGGNIALKLLIGSAVGLVLGVGTCGLGATLGGGDKSLYMGLTLFVVSLAGFLISAIWLLIAMIIGWNRR